MYSIYNASINSAFRDWNLTEGCSWIFVLFQPLERRTSLRDKAMVMEIFRGLLMDKMHRILARAEIRMYRDMCEKL